MVSLTLAFQPDFSSIRCRRTCFLAFLITAAANAVAAAVPANTTRDALSNRFDSLNSTDAFEQLAAVLRSEGATISPSLCLSRGVVRGVAAAHDVAVNETLLNVPSRLILSGATVTRNGAGCAVSRLLAECDGKARRKNEDCEVLLPGKNHGSGIVGMDKMASRELELAAFFVQKLHNFTSDMRNSNESQGSWPVCEAGDFPTNVINLYLKTLPSREDLQGLPVFSAMQPRCRQLLNGTWASHMAEGQRAQWAKEWAVLLKRVPEMKHFSADEFFYARAIIMTRTFGMRASPEAQLEPVLVPLGDMFNEEDRKKPGVAWDDQHVGERGFRLTTMHKAPSGDEFFITYGRKPNFLMYLTYGFFFDHHPMELVPLELRPFPGEASAADAGRVVSLLKGIPSTVELYFEGLEMQLPSILGFARAMVLADVNTSVSPGWRPSDPMPLKLERRALDLLYGHVEAQVRRRSGQDGLAMLDKPFELAASSASCERYARLNNEPYGALLDFADEGRHFLDLRIGSTPSSSSGSALHSAHSRATPLRKKWASRLVQRWSRQVDPKTKGPKIIPGTRKPQKAVFLGA